MLKRLITSLALAAIGIPAVIYGGVFFWLLFAFFLSTAAWEFTKLMRGAGFQPAMVISVGGVLTILFARTVYPEYESAVLVALVFIAMTYHLIAFELGRNEAAGDFSITITSLIYMGWIGAYLVKLRNLPGGLWWFFLVLPIIWFTDSGAYLIGKNFGKHKLSPRLSPKKTWEGSIGGLLFTLLFAWLIFAVTKEMNLQDWLYLSVIIAVTGTLGDLAESLLKRNAGVKDSGKIIPGHGGVLDRFDATLFAVPFVFLYFNFINV